MDHLAKKPKLSSRALAGHSEPRLVILSEAKDLVLLRGVNSAIDLATG
jgi:hypothetical protein